ncbi:MAG: T9SS C-terminal target domain-containing protein [Cytophagales bacterium]|nr:MAG: T9SS C-terminal target domain-containing protein [Cytophagales bacterium]
MIYTEIICNIIVTKINPKIINMKKTLLSISFLVCLQALFAQTAPFGNTRYKGQNVPDRIFQDCEGNIFSLNDLMADKPLIITQSTVDCGYCIEEAPSVSADLIKYKDKINFAFFLTRHNTFPRCESNGNRTFDYPDDWRNNFPGYKNIPICISGTDYFLLHCEVTTSYGILDPKTNNIVAGGCRSDGRKNAIAAALKMYDDGLYTSFNSTVLKPEISFSGNGNSRTISLSTSTSGAEIYYTTDGTTPSKSSSKYSGTFTVDQSRLVKAIAYKDQMNVSPVSIKFIDINNSSLVNIAPQGDGFEWVGMTSNSANSTRRSFPAVNDGKLVDALLNNGSDDSPNAFEAAGVIWDEVKKNIVAAKLTHYTPPNNPMEIKFYLGHGMKLQTTQDGQTWTDLNYGYFPEYPYGNGQKNMNTSPIVYFGDKPISAKGIRIVGQVRISGVNWGGQTARVWGLKEIEVFQNNSITDIENSFNQHGVKVYPNPAKNLINIDLANNNFSQIILLDVTGREVFTNKVTSQTEKIDLSDLKKGLYILQLNGNSSNYRQTIVVE